MTDFDDRIRGALDEDDRAFLASLDEGRGLFTQFGDVLSGPLGGWARIVFVAAFFLTFAMAYAIWQLLIADTTRELVLWATASLAGLMASGFTKDWFFSRMNMMTVLREVKRLQLQVALLEQGAPARDTPRLNP